MSIDRGKGIAISAVLADSFDIEQLVDNVEAAQAAAEAAQAAAELAETNAETAETNAETAETNAETAETNAETAQAAAEAAQTAAETAETAAETAQVAAETAQTGAETAETNAETAQAAAETAQAAAEAALDTFDDRFLGTKTSDPTVDNDGNALVEGAMYYNSTANDIRFYNGSSWDTPVSDAQTAQTAAETAQAAAETAQTAAETAETNAETAETNASTSATNAASSATSAASSASSASTSASNASTSETNAATSETNAATSASNASTSETNAATSASAAASSATAAATSAANAASSYDSFDDRYLGSKASNPTVDNDGDALVSGALYFNTTDSEMRIYDGSNWIAASSASIETMEKFTFTATSGQTVFSGSDDNAKTLALTVGVEMVTLNGIVLEETTDYTRTSTSVTLTSGAATDDELNVYAFGNFTVADTVSASSGGTFNGTVTFDGGANFGDNDKAQFGASQDLQIYHDGSNSYIKDAGTGKIKLLANEWNVNNSADTANMIVAKEGAEIKLHYNGSNKLATTSTGVDVTGNVIADNIGIGTSSPSASLDIQNVSTNYGYSLKANSSSTANLYIGHQSSGANNRMIVSHNWKRNGSGYVKDDSGYGVSSVAFHDGYITFGTDSSSGNSYATERMRIDDSGNLLVGTTDVNNNTSDGIRLKSDGTLQIRNDNSDFTAVINRSNASDGEIIRLQKSNTTVGSIYSTAGLYTVYNSVNYGYLGVNGSLKYSWDGTKFRGVADNTFDLGSSGDRWKNLYLSGGVYVGGTGSANYLDDYEEGTYTWTLTGNTSGSMTPRSGYQTGSYEKIGNQVTVRCKWETQGTHNATGYLKMSLPFTCANLTDLSEAAAAATFIYRTSAGDLTNPTWILHGGLDYMIMYYNNTSNDVVTLNGGDVDSAIEGYFTITYRTT